MKKYTKEQLLKAVEYGCNYQKNRDYLFAGFLLNIDDNIDNLRAELYKGFYSNPDNNSAEEITIEQVEKYIK